MAKIPKAVREQAVREYLRRITRKGGLARAKALTAKQRSASARKAVQARWAKAKKTPR